MDKWTYRKVIIYHTDKGFEVVIQKGSNVIPTSYRNPTMASVTRVDTLRKIWGKHVTATVGEGGMAISFPWSRFVS